MVGLVWLISVFLDIRVILTISFIIKNRQIKLLRKRSIKN